MNASSDRLLDVKNLQKRYSSSGTLAIEDITLDVRPREFVSIVGPSGCGKTTLLKTICGLLHPSAGSVTLDGKRIVEPPPEMVLVFQDYARSLFPWLTVAQNVAFPLKKKKLAADVKKRLIEDSLRSVNLSKFANHYPWQLSGGMQQRVAIARAIAFQPEILLLDEPFASVDALTRAELEDLTLKIRDEVGVTMLLVTHDIDEAVYLSDRVFVLSPPPSIVVRSFDIPLGRERDQERTRSDARFLELRNEIHHLIGRPREAVKAQSAASSVSTVGIKAEAAR